MTQHREPNLVSASSLGSSMMKCLAPPLKISYAERLSRAKVERWKRILLQFNFMFVVFTCLPQKRKRSDRDRYLFSSDKFASARWWYCFVRMWYSSQERWHLFAIPKWNDWWRKSNFFSFGEIVFKFSLIKTSAGNLDPLKFPLKSIKWSFIQNKFWSSLYFKVLRTLGPLHPQACWHIFALDGTVHLAVTNLLNSESSAQTSFLISYWHCAFHVRCRPIRRTLFPLWELVQSVPHKIHVL